MVFNLRDVGNQPDSTDDILIVFYYCSHKVVITGWMAEDGTYYNYKNKVIPEETIVGWLPLPDTYTEEDLMDF